MFKSKAPKSIADEVLKYEKNCDCDYAPIELDDETKLFAALNEKEKTVKYEIIFTLKDGNILIANETAPVLLDGMIQTVHMVLNTMIETQLDFTFIGDLGLSAETVKSIQHYKVMYKYC